MSATMIVVILSVAAGALIVPIARRVWRAINDNRILDRRSNQQTASVEHSGADRYDAQNPYLRESQVSDTRRPSIPRLSELDTQASTMRAVDSEVPIAQSPDASQPRGDTRVTTNDHVLSGPGSVNDSLVIAPRRAVARQVRQPNKSLPPGRLALANDLPAADLNIESDYIPDSERILGVLRGRSAGQLYKLATPKATIGVGPDSTVVVRHPSIAELHAEMWFARGSWWLRQIDGERTSVNGEALDRKSITQLHIGDRVQFGEADELIVWIPGADVTNDLRLEVAQRRYSRQEDTANPFFAAVSSAGMSSGFARRPTPERAAACVLHALRESIATQSPENALRYANDTLIAASRDNTASTGMVATGDVVKLVRDPDGTGFTLHGAHLGDTVVLIVDDDDVARAPGVTDYMELAMSTTRAGASDEDQRHRGVARGAGVASNPSINTWKVPAAIGTRIVIATASLADSLGVDNLIKTMQRARARTSEDAAGSAIDRAIRRISPSEPLAILVVDVVQEDRPAKAFAQRG